MPTQKQIEATKNIVEKRGKSISRAMLEAGYSPQTAKNPKNLTNSKGFGSITEELRNELGNINVTPKRLAHIIRRGLDAKQPGKMIIIDKSKPDKDGNTRVTTKTYQAPDHAIRHKYLETSLKIFAAYPQEDKSPTTLILAQFRGMVSEYAEPDEPIEGEVVE